MARHSEEWSSNICEPLSRVNRSFPWLAAGTEEPFPDRQRKARQRFSGGRVADGELAAVGGGAPFANADRWTRAEKGAHVKVHFPQKRMWSGNSLIGNAGVSDILIPMTDRQAPAYLLVYNGDTYRAFFNLPETTVKELQELLGALKK